MCKRSQRDGFRAPCPGIEEVPECPRGEVPRLMSENERFRLFLVSRIFPGLCDGWGAFRYETISEAFRMYNIPDGERPVLMDKCLMVIRAIQEVREAERPNRQPS